VTVYFGIDFRSYGHGLDNKVFIVIDLSNQPPKVDVRNTLNYIMIKHNISCEIDVIKI